ncbi:FAD-binding protein [Vogesella facilis]|uniref:FAD-binding protein n=1 Tax=Vogesella facilis TaxID=1655232 RepID=A0ABV7REQ2_9NEIS
MIVNDVTQLNPVPVFAISAPTSVAEVQDALARTDGPVSVGGGHFSMGGQTASPGSLHLDMRQLNRVLGFDPQARTIRVQAGIRWCDIQAFIDPHELSVMIMQTYANFTVGGSLSVNAHGRYMGVGPIVLSVRQIALVLPDGRLEQASPSQQPALFYAAIGGYGAIGIIVEVELQLTNNVRVQRSSRKMSLANYGPWFGPQVREERGVVFHNADLYAPHYQKLRAVSWTETKHPVTVTQRLHSHRRLYPLHKYLLWAMSETPLGRERREHLLDPLLYLGKPVHWRNYEAGYDAAELEPLSRLQRTYVLQEYFIPVGQLEQFVPKMAEILQRHRANVLNISIRHAAADPGTLLAWARGETFAFVLYYKQRTRRNACNRVAIWTRELIEAVLSAGGTYYLPYQLHATPEQFHRAYPGALSLFALKRQLDPHYRLRNALWDKYYAPTLNATPPPRPPRGDFDAIYSDTVWQDHFYRFLQNVFHLYPEDRFHTLILDSVLEGGGDEAIYRRIQANLRTIKPILAELRYALPALAKQKREMTRQTLQLLGERRRFLGYVEIGSTGRYLSQLQHALRLQGDRVLIHDRAPGNSPVDVVERGGLRQLARFVPLGDYAPIASNDIADQSVELVSCYIGLHHIAPDKLMPFLASIARILAPGGTFILRDHDVNNPQMAAFVSLAHTVFNAGLGEPWSVNVAERRHFVDIATWVERLAQVGLRDSGQRLLQAHDPSHNVLMAFTKEAY